MGCLRSVGITGMGSYAPEKVMTNFDFEKIVDTSDEWIRTRTGIGQRHVAAEDQSTSDLAAIAAMRAMEDAKVNPEEIDLIINTLVTPDMIIPATACFIQRKAGCKNAAAFDLFAGCTGFVYGLVVAHQMVATGAYKKVLVIGCDLLTKLTDWTDRNTCVLFGDGGGAAIVQEVEEGYGFFGQMLKADGSGAECIELPGGATKNPATHQTIDDRLHFIKMKGNDVFKFAVRVMADTAQKLSEQTGIKLEDVDLIVPHQANDRILESAARMLKLPRERFFSNLEFYGNTSAGSIPLALVDARKQGLLKKGDTVFLIGFGAGLTWGGLAIRWAY